MGPVNQQSCNCLECTECYDRFIYSGRQEEVLDFHENTESRPCQITEQDRLYAEENDRRHDKQKKALDQMVMNNKCLFPEKSSSKGAKETLFFTTSVFKKKKKKKITPVLDADLKEDWHYQHYCEKMPVMIASKILQQCYEINEAHFEL